MEKKFKIVEFATLVGGSPKSIYDRISKFDELPENEKLFTIKERIKGREVAYIVTNDEQIKFYQKLYGKLTSMNGNYEENVIYNEVDYIENESNLNSRTNNNNISSYNLEDILDRIVTYSKDVNEDIININNSYNEKLFKLQEELITYKSKVPLLEDKANREGLYLKEIDELKKDIESKRTYNEKLLNYIKWLIVFIIFIFLIIIGLFSFNYFSLKSNYIENNQVETVEIQEVQNVPQPQATSINKKVNNKKRGSSL